MTVTYDQGLAEQGTWQQADDPGLGSLLSAIVAADRANATVVTCDVLRDLTSRLLEMLETAGWPAVFGASAVGDRLVGALAFADSQVRVWTPGQPCRVAIVDGVVAGTVGLSLTAERCRALGASDVLAVVAGFTSDSGVTELRLPLLVVDPRFVLAAGSQADASELRRI